MNVMKKWMLLILLTCSCSVLWAQGYGGPTFTVSNHSSGSTLLLSGGFGGWSHKGFFLGGGGYGLLNTPVMKAEDNTLLNLTELGYGGIQVGYDHYFNKHFGASGYFMIGAGGLTVNDQDFALWIVEPKTQVFAQPLRFMRIGIGYGYRWSFQDEVNPIDLSGHAIHFILSFGSIK